MSRLRRLAGFGCVVGVALALLAAPVVGEQRARPVPPAPVPEADTPPAPTGPRGENFSAKPAPQLFASDCTGAGCHRGPQGLAKGQSASALAGFLRQHYTNSQQSAAALAAYLAGVPGAPADARPARQKAERPRTPAEPNGTPKQEQRKTATTARPHKGKQATVEPTNAPAPAAETPAAVAPAPAPPPPPKTFDIFD